MVLTREVIPPAWRRVVQVSLVSLLVWTVMAVPAIFQAHGFVLRSNPHAPLFPDIWDYLRWYWLQAVLAIPLFFMAVRFPLNTRPYWKSGLLYLGGFFAFFGCIAMFRAYPFSWFQNPGEVPVSLLAMASRMFHNALVQWLWTYVMIVAVSHMAEFYGGLKRKEIDEVKLRMQLTLSELEILKLQLQPHFFFNSLNGISALMSSDVLRARSMIAQLADLVRASLKHNAAAEISLDEELEFVDSYVELQQMRLGDRFIFRKEISPTAKTASVPSMLVQPLLENAIKHGIECSRGQGRVELHITRDEGMIAIAVINDRKNENSSDDTSGTGIGLANLRARLQALYGGTYRLTMNHTANRRTTVTLEFPFRSAAAREDENA